MYICPECNSVIEASTQDATDDPLAKYCKLGHLGREPSSFLRGVIWGLRAPLLLAILAILVTYHLFGNVDIYVFVGMNILCVVVGAYYLFQGLKWRKKGGAVRCLSNYPFGLCVGLVGFAAFVDWMVFKYH